MFDCKIVTRGKRSCFYNRLALLCGWNLTLKMNWLKEKTIKNSAVYILYEIYTYTFDFLKRFYTQNDRVRVNKATSTRTRYKFIFSTSLISKPNGTTMYTFSRKAIFS